MATIVSQGLVGVDMNANPLLLAKNKLAFAHNLEFKQGVMRTRNSIHLENLDVKGRFQGCCNYSPSMGLSHNSFGSTQSAIVFVVSGNIHAAGLDKDGELACRPFLVAKDVFPQDIEVNVFQAENYLIFHCEHGQTYWWDGSSITESKGIGVCCDENFEKNLASFQEDRVHELANGAGLGIYSHGRISQQVRNVILVGDLIHKRGYRRSDDILSMEEQMAASHDSPLSVPSSYGKLMALELLPSLTESAYGEGRIIAYHENGVAAHSIFDGKRETRYEVKGQLITEGWDTKRLTDTILNTVSAVGRYAVAVTPRDHIFRSKFGIHYLKSASGSGTTKRTSGSEVTNDEATNHIAHDVQPILDLDDASSLKGNSTSFWLKGNRIFSTFLLEEKPSVSVSPTSRFFSSFNRSAIFAESEIPVAAWEGSWSLDNGMAGIHRFIAAGEHRNHGGFGIISSDKDSNLYYGSIRPYRGYDTRNGQRIPIKWGFVTGMQFAGDIKRTKEISDARIEFISETENSELKIWIKTDKSHEWELWKDIEKEQEGFVLRSESLGKPPEQYRDATWFQFKVTGDGQFELFSLDVDMTSGADKSGKSKTIKINRFNILDTIEDDY